MTSACRAPAGTARRLACAGLLACAAALAGTSVEAETCAPPPPRAKARSTAGRDCLPPRKFEPYDPDRQRAGSRPGFIDLGNGTEVRIGGRARLEYDTRR